MRSFILTMAVITSSVLGKAQTLVDGYRALSSIEILASDSLQGRRSGLPGGEKAAAWIANQFLNIGLQPGVGDTSFFQDFSITTAVESGPMVMQLWPASAETEPFEFEYGSDFVSFAYGGAGRVQGQVVFVGYGIQEPSKGRDDLAGADLKGKVALALRGAPNDGEGFWGREGGHGYKAAHAADAGAIAYLQVGEGPCMQRTLGVENRRANVPCFWISRKACDRLLAASRLTVDSLFARANTQRSGCHLDLAATLQVEANAGVIPNAATRNVVGIFPGSDPRLAHEMVLVGAHMDHLGVDAVNRIFHGADDNASGAALVLELARTLVADPIPPRRSIAFVTFTGEDLGLLGSEEFVAHPPLPLDSIVTMINLDMVGVGQGISLGGFPNFPAIWDIWELVMSDSLRQSLRHFKPGYYSDHAPFEDLGIPAFFIDTGGDHPHYHQPEDEAALIQPELMAQVGDIVYQGLRAIADHPASLVEADRLTHYLWHSSETVLLNAPTLPPPTLDDGPDLVLYEAGKTIDQASRNRLRRLLLELSRLDSTLNADSLNMRKVASFVRIPSGQLVPGVALGLASPKLVENTPEIYTMLAKLGVLFVHVPQDDKAYFGVRGLKKPAGDLIAQLESAPQAVIWDVNSLTQAYSLFVAATRPLVVQVNGSAKPVTKSELKLLPGQFLLLSARAVKDLEVKEFQALAASVGWYNLGVQADGMQEATPLISTWQKAGFSHGRIHDLLGLNLVRYLRKMTVDR